MLKGMDALVNKNALDHMSGAHSIKKESERRGETKQEADYYTTSNTGANGGSGPFSAF